MYSQKGYIGSSMSVRAKDCYDSGIMPLSKWRKNTFIEQVEDELGLRIRKISGSYKDFLIYDSWHHTSKFYNSTAFYKIDFTQVSNAIDSGEIACFTEAEVAEIDELEHKKQKEKQEEIIVFRNEFRKQELQEMGNMKNEIISAEKIERISKKGNKMVTVLITERQPLLYEKMIEKHYIPIKGLTMDLGMIAELKLS